MRQSFKGFDKFVSDGMGYESLQIVFCVSAQLNERSIEQHISQFLIEFPNHKLWSQNHPNVTAAIENHLPLANNDSNEGIAPADSRNFVWQGGQCRFEDAAATHYLINPDNKQHQSLDNVSSILSYDNQLTTFIGRKRELETLEEWLKTAPSKSIQLVYGDGGVGKTRLASYFAREKAIKMGWKAGFAHPLEHGIWEAGQKGIVFIIDHPEYQPDRVKDFLRTVLNHNDNNKSLKILLISRNLDYLNELTSEIQNLSISHMPLLPIDQTDIAWDLFRDAWYGLNDVLKKDGREQKQHPPDFETFSSWIQQDPLINAMPLMIIALAYYLFIESDIEKASFLELTTPKIIRYFSEREARLISTEVKKYVSANPHLAKEIEPKGVCLLKAIAAITRGMEPDSIRKICKDLDLQTTDYPPPAYKYLGQLSLLTNNKLSAITPSLLAADFLAYCLQPLPLEQILYWLYAATGLNQKDPEKIYLRLLTAPLLTLIALLDDAQHVLKLPFPFKGIGCELNKNSTINAWVYLLSKESWIKTLYANADTLSNILMTQIAALESNRNFIESKKEQIDTEKYDEFLKNYNLNQEIFNQSKNDLIPIYENIASLSAELVTTLLASGFRIDAEEHLLEAITNISKPAKENFNIFGMPFTQFLALYFVEFEMKDSKAQGKLPMFDLLRNTLLELKIQKSHECIEDILKFVIAETELVEDPDLQLSVHNMIEEIQGF